MLGWNNDSAYEVDGGFSWSYVIEIETDDYYHPSPNADYDPRTDKNEVIIRKGVITNIYSQQEFADKYQIEIVFTYDFLKISPKDVI